MNKNIIKMSDKDSKTITDLLKVIKENKGVRLTSKDLLHFLTYFNFIEVCKNDESINQGYKPKKEFYKKGILQYDVYEIRKNNRIYKKSYTIKITKKGENFLMPFILGLINIKNMAKNVKSQK